MMRIEDEDVFHDWSKQVAPLSTVIKNMSQEMVLMPTPTKIGGVVFRNWKLNS